MFLDGGDLFHGSLPLVSTKGESILLPLHKLGLDGFVPGNWDFAYGKDQIKQLIKSVPFPSIACNLFDVVTEKTFVEPYFIKDMPAGKVAVIGLTYPYVDQTMPKSFSEGLVFTIGVEEVRRSLDNVREEADLIILVSHMGLPLDVKLASLVNGIDVILSSHSHDRVTKPIVNNGTLIIQAGSNSSFLGQLDLFLDNGKITDVTYKLISIDESLEEDLEIREVIQDILKPFEDKKHQLIGYTDLILHRMTLNEAPMDRLITDAYQYSYDCDLAFSHGWRYGCPIASGAISMYDLYNVIPTNPEIFRLEMEGNAIRDMLENNLEQVFSSDPFEQKGGYILRSSGLFMTYKPYNPKGHRIQNLLIGGREINLHKTYKIVAGGKQILKSEEDSKNYLNTNAINVISSYLKDIKIFKPGEEHRIISV